MKSRNVFILVVAGVVLAALAWITSRDKTPAGANRIGNKLMPGLAINAIDEVIISTTAQTARVAKVNNSWLLPDRYDYPANFETIRRLMMKLADLKIGQAFNASDRQREQMDLTPDAATTITLKANGNALVELQLGVNRESNKTTPTAYGMGGMTDGRYLAIKDDPMVYLVGESLHEAKADSKQWMDTSLLDVSAEKVTTITITNPEDGTFSLVKDEDGKLNFKDAEPGKPFDNTKDYSLKGALSYLTLKDIADPEADDAALGFTNPRRFSVDTEDGTTYNLLISEPIDASNERYIRIAVTNTPPATTMATKADEEPEESQGNETTNNTVVAESKVDDAAKNAAKALHTKLSPWTFRIVSYKADTLTSSRESLVKAPEAASEDLTDPTDRSDRSDQSGDIADQPETTTQPESKDTNDE